MELKLLLAPIRKWWWLILASGLIAGLTSFYTVSQQPPIYRTSAVLLFGSAINNPNPTGFELFLSEKLAKTYTDIAQLEVVRKSTMEKLGLEWLPSYATRVYPDSQLIEVEVTDSSPERAMVVANELANQLILRSPATATSEEEVARQAFIGEQLAELEVSIKETRDSINAKQEELSGLFSARQIADAQNQIAALNQKLISLQNNYASLAAGTSGKAYNSLSIIQPAEVPVVPVGPERLMTVFTAMAIGMSLAIGAAYLLEYLDDTIKNPEDVQHVSKLPILAGIAEYKPENGHKHKLVTIDQPRSPIAEAYRTLRTAVLFSNVDHKLRTILITSPSPSEGKSTTVANLGVVLAQAGHQVLIVDADFRKPKQKHIFNVRSGGYGLTNLLVDMDGSLNPEKMVELLIQVNRAAVPTGQPGLRVITSGPTPPDPADTVGSSKMKLLLDILKTRFDYIIIDSPPLLAVTDSVILSTRADGVFVVAAANMTRRNHLKQALQQLQDVNAPNFTGIILNRLTASSGDYYYYYYRSNYYTQEDDRTDGQSGGDDGDGGSWVEKALKGGINRRLLPDFFTRILS